MSEDFGFMFSVFRVLYFLLGNVFVCGMEGGSACESFALNTDSLSPVAVTHGQGTELILASCPPTSTYAQLPPKR